MVQNTILYICIYIYIYIHKYIYISQKRQKTGIPCCCNSNSKQKKYTKLSIPNSIQYKPSKCTFLTVNKFF